MNISGATQEDAPELNGASRTVETATDEDNPLQGRHVQVGNGERREELVTESRDTAEQHLSSSCSSVEHAPNFPLAEQDSRGSSIQKRPEEVWVEHLRSREIRVANFEGSDEKKRFLGEQMEILKEKIRLMCPQEDSGFGEQWVFHLLAVFDDLVSHLKSGMIPEMSLGLGASLNEGKSIIQDEYRKFEFLTSWLPLGQDFEQVSRDVRAGRGLYGFEESGFSRESLRRYVNELTANLEEKKSAKSYAVDRLLMDDLVEFENKINPGINMHHVQDAYEFNSTLKRLLGADESSECSLRFMVCAGVAPAEVESKHGVRFFANERLVHYCAVDVRRSEGKVSVLLLEPVTLDGDPFLILKRKIMADFSLEFPDSRISFIGVDVQRSDGECHIFCLSFLRKAFSQKIDFDALHGDNISGRLGLMSDEMMKNIIPIKFMKHAQSSGRIADYLRANEALQGVHVNKKRQTLVERFDEHLLNSGGPGRGRMRGSISIHKKRLSIIEAYAKSIDLNSAGTEKMEGFEKID